MTTSSYFLLVALGLLLYVCQSSFGNQYTRDPDTTADINHICGPDVFVYFGKLCPGKRNDAGKKRGRASPLWKRRRFLSMLKARAKRNEAFLLQRAQPNIVSECCEKGCTNEEFKHYCPSLLG
uniref:Venom gland insulin La1 n=1 Tax=Conus laterculatus TaxID=552401 RepID=A0A8T9ISR5_9COND|nr:venom gland insulin precursor La1 [Conus laterculatus]